MSQHQEYQTKMNALKQAILFELQSSLKSAWGRLGFAHRSRIVRVVSKMAALEAGKLLGIATSPRMRELMLATLANYRSAGEIIVALEGRELVRQILAAGAKAAEWAAGKVLEAGASYLVELAREQEDGA